MMKIVIKETRRGVSISVIGVNPMDAIRKISMALGDMTDRTIKLDKGEERMDAYREICENVLIPSFLEGAGCKRISE